MARTFGGLARGPHTITIRVLGVDWTTVGNPHQGRAEIFVDGEPMRNVDNYAAEPTFGVVRSIGGLPPGLHTLRIVVLGESRPAASGTFVSVDRLEVRA